MWPKMLLELLPHVGRLVPMAEKFLNSRSTSEREHAAALAALGESVRGDVGEVGERQSGIQRALQEQGLQLGEIAVEVTRVRMGVETVESRVAKLEQKASVVVRLLVVVVVMLVAALVVLAVVLMHLRAR